MARKILLADDSVTAQNMGRKILSDAGYDVVTVNNGSAALKRVAELKPDVVVLDIYMPGYGGLEVCQRLKDSPETERIPVLLTVGKLEPFKPDEARRVRADAYIIKPFEATELLSALARMEDRIVPAQEDNDTSWKSRLRFPTKKKKEESEPEFETVEAPSGRGSQRGKSRVSSSAREAASEAPELSVVPDIPRDITPEELDALSALAAKLDRPAAEKVPPSQEEPPLAEAEASPEACEPVGKDERATEVAACDPERGEEAEALAANALAEATPAMNTAEPPPVSEVQQAEAVHVETLAAEPAPVDREDEPLFAVATSAVAPVPQEQTTEPSEVSAASGETAAEASRPETLAEEAKAGQQEAEQPAPQVVERVEAEASPVAEAASETEETTNAQAISETMSVITPVEQAELGPAPSDAELAEALRLLTPELTHSDPLPIPVQGDLAASGAISAHQAAQDASEAPRWVATPVALSPEEAAASLESEMFHTLAGAAENESPAIAATVATSPTADSGDAGEGNAEAGEEIPAAAIANHEDMSVEVTTFGVEVAQAEQQASSTEQEEAEEQAPATFAEAVRQAETEELCVAAASAVTSDVVVPVEKVGPVTVKTMDVPASTVTAEGEETMSKQRTKAGKSSWHEIRPPAAAGATGSDVVEAAKQGVPEEEAPKAMAAAAAAADSTASSAISPDSNTIASIVDSVLADLRPKIVEEIAKKLAGK